MTDPNWTEALVRALHPEFIPAWEAAYAQGRAEGIEAAAKVVDGQARSAQDLYDLISVQSELPIAEPTFSCAGLAGIATAIRALIQEPTHDK